MFFNNSAPRTTNKAYKTNGFSTIPFPEPPKRLQKQWIFNNSAPRTIKKLTKPMFFQQFRSQNHQKAYKTNGFSTIPPPEPPKSLQNQCFFNNSVLFRVGVNGAGHCTSFLLLGFRGRRRNNLYNYRKATGLVFAKIWHG